MDGVLVVTAVVIPDPEHPNIIIAPMMRCGIKEPANAIAGFHISVLISFEKMIVNARSEKRRYLC
jgi:hypothetical protein